MYLDGAHVVVLATVIVDNRHVVVSNVLLLLSEVSVVSVTRHQRRNVKYHCNHTAVSPHQTQQYSLSHAD